MLYSYDCYVALIQNFHNFICILTTKYCPKVQIVNKQIHRNVININACLPLKFDSFAAKLTLGLLRKRGQDEFSGIKLQNCFEFKYFTKLFSLIIKTMKIIEFSCWPDTKTWTNDCGSWLLLVPDAVV